MHKKQGLFNFSLAFAMLFAILFQSLHSAEHLFEQITEKHCKHETSQSKTQLTHQHHNFDHCPICDFTFSAFVASSQHGIVVNSVLSETPYFFFQVADPEILSSEIITLRGPPQFIV